MRAEAKQGTEPTSACALASTTLASFAVAGLQWTLLLLARFAVALGPVLGYEMVLS